jgi:hypothetical protein
MRIQVPDTVRPYNSLQAGQLIFQAYQRLVMHDERIEQQNGKKRKEKKHHTQHFNPKGSFQTKIILYLSYFGRFHVRLQNKRHHGLL